MNCGRNWGATVIKRSMCRATAFAILLAAIFFGVATVAQAQGKWRLGAPIPQGANEVIGAPIDGQVFVYGGQDPLNKPQGIFYKYDPGKNDWTQLPANPVPVHHGAAVSIGHKFYVIGGFRLPDSGKGGWYPENKAWVFDTETQNWSALPNMPTARGALAAVAVGKKIYVIGGGTIPKGKELPNGLTPGGDVELLGTMEVLDTDTNTWSSSGADADPTQSPQRRLCGRQDLRDRRARRLLLFRWVVIQRLDE